MYTKLFLKNTVSTGEYLGVAAVLLLLSPIMLMMALHKN